MLDELVVRDSFRSGADWIKIPTPMGFYKSSILECNSNPVYKRAYTPEERSDNPKVNVSGGELSLRLRTKRVLSSEVVRLRSRLVFGY